MANNHTEPPINGANGNSHTYNGAAFNGQVNYTTSPASNTPIEARLWEPTISSFNQGFLKSHGDNLNALRDQTPETFDAPAIDKAFIEGITGKADASKIVGTHAKASFTANSPYSDDAFIREKMRLSIESKFNDWRMFGANISLLTNPNFEEVAVSEGKVKNAHYPWFRVGFDVAVLICGMGALCFTMASFLNGSDKLPWLYGQPVYLAGIFGFVPIGMMFILARAFDWIKNRALQGLYLFGLFATLLVVAYNWQDTFGLAYSTLGDSDDIFQEAPIDYFAFNIRMQLIGEVLLGALLKIDLHVADRSWRKTVTYQSTIGQVHLANGFEVQSLSYVNRDKANKLDRSHEANKATEKRYALELQAALNAAEDKQKALDDAANAAAEAARAAHKFNGKKPT